MREYDQHSLNTYPCRLDDQGLRLSLIRQKKILKSSIVLTPVDSFHISPLSEALEMFEGFYATDRPRDENGIKSSKIFFSGRNRLTHDMRQIYREWAQKLGADDLSMRLLSGLHAHLIVFMGLSRFGESVMLLPETAGGHFATKGILGRLGYRVIEIPIDTQRHRIDVNGALALFQRTSPDYIFIDRSEGLVFEDFTPLVSQTSAYSIFDASQYLPQILEGHYPSPFEMGFNVVLSTLHKSFPGPQKALVATNNKDEHWGGIKLAMSELVSSLDVRGTYQAGLALGEQERLGAYTSLMLENALELETELHRAGLPVVQRSRNDPPTQHLWIPMGGRDAAYRLFKHLEQCRVQTTYRLLPYDLGYGLRIGTPAATMQGLRPEHAAELASIFAAACFDGFSLSLRHRVRTLSEIMDATRIGPDITG